jgi:hypothetical protein
MFYYSIYPEWNDIPEKMFSSEIINNCYGGFDSLFLINKEINYEKYKNDSKLYTYMRNKPFKPYPNLSRSDLKNNTIINFKPFDEVVKSLISERPDMLKYFEYIKTYRIVFF